MIRSLVLLKSVSVLGSEDTQFLEGVTLASLSFESWVQSRTSQRGHTCPSSENIDSGGSSLFMPSHSSCRDVLTQEEQELLRNKEKRIFQHPSSGETWVKGAPLGTF